MLVQADSSKPVILDQLILHMTLYPDEGRYLIPPFTWSLLMAPYCYCAWPMLFLLFWARVKVLPWLVHWGIL